ncbi:MAG: type II secretion system protein, partial [Haloferula sp.]
MQFNRPARIHHGFTLVELLVVITIVVVLASLAFMGSRKAMDASHNASCVTSLRQLATAGQSYVAEHGAYPNQGRQMDGSTTWWFKAMEVELGFEPGTSPSIIERAETMPTCKKCLRTHGPVKPGDRFIRTYSMNHDLIGPTRNADNQWAFPGLRATRVVNPSATAFFMDGSLANGPYWQYLTRRDQWLKPENFVHNDKAN